MPKNDDLVSIVELYERRVDDKRKARLAGSGVVGSISSNLPLAEDLIERYLDDPQSLAGTSHLCTARVRDQYGCPKYNRTEEIDLHKCDQSIEEKSGFSYRAAGTGSGWVRPYGKQISNTQSGHRVTMRYAVELDPNARTVLNLSFHDPRSTYDQIIQIESDDHFTDCADRKNQTGTDKFKSAYHAKRDWAVKLYDFCKPYGISIAGTLPKEETKFELPSHSFLSKSLAAAGEGNTKKYLDSFCGHNCETLIQASCVKAGALFLKQFSSQIYSVDKKNNVDSFDMMMKWWFCDYGPALSIAIPDSRNVTQLDIIDGGGLYKGNEPAMARFVYLYNKYVAKMQISDKWEISGRNVTAIPFNGSKDENGGWEHFISNSSHLIRASLPQLANQQFWG